MTLDDEDQHLLKKEMKARMTVYICCGQIKDQAQTAGVDRSTYSVGNIVQIVSGRIATDPTVNVHEAVVIGTEMMKQYESTWPGGIPFAAFSQLGHTRHG